MDDLASLINKRAKQIVVDGKKDELQIIQEEVNRFYARDVSAVKIYKDGNLLLEVCSSSLASNIFMRREEILQSINAPLKVKLKGLRTKVV